MTDLSTVFSPEGGERLFLNVIARTVSTPGLTGGIINEELKASWVEHLGEELKEVYQTYPTLYTYLEHHLNTKGHMMSLGGRDYLIDILTDEAREVVIQKSVQCGLTEIALARAYTSACLGRAVLYVLPSHPVRNRFVANRVDRQLKTSPYYRAQVKSANELYGDKTSDARSLKHMGLGVLHFVGSNTEGEFSEFPADELIVDEQDLCDPENLGLARDRLSESDYKRVLRISNPRKPGAPHSIGLAYENSNQKEWHVKCLHCRKEQVLDWHNHFVVKTKAGRYRLRDKQGRPICIKCEKAFNRLGPGRWITRDKENRVSGYKISKLFTPSADILELFNTFTEAQYNDTLLQIFYASELGEYYVPKSSGLSLSSLQDAIDDELIDWPEVDEDVVVVMGVDVGAMLHYKASYLDEQGRRVAMDIGTVGSFGELEALADELGPSMIVIDAHPELHKVVEFADESRWEVCACNFGSPEQIAPVKIDIDAHPPTVTANRTSVMDASFAAILKGEMILPACAASVPEFFAQMQVPKRQWDAEAAKGRGRFVWTKGNDHYRLADTYEWIAMQIVSEMKVRMTEL
jgi:hypothetical protein